MKTRLLSLTFALIAMLTLTAQTWTMVGDPPMNGHIKTIAVDSNNKQYVAGRFSYGPTDNGLSYVAKWDFVDWEDLGNFGGNGSIDKMVIDANDKLYMIGAFKNSSGKYYVATYDGTAWIALGGLVSANPILDIAIQGNTIYIAGNFTSTINGQTFYINKWNGTSWSMVDDGVFNGTVNSLSIDKDNNLNAGGNFKNNFGFYCIFKQNGTSWSEVGKLKSANPVQKILCDKLGKVYAYTGESPGNYNNRVLSRYNKELNTWSVLYPAYAELKFVDDNNNVYSTTTCGTPCQNTYVKFSPNSENGVEKYVSFSFAGAVTAISMDKFGYPLVGSYFSSNSNQTLGIVKSSEKEVLGTSEILQKSSIEIFPNPSAGIFTVKNSEKINSISVYDVTGKIVKIINSNKTETKVDLSGNPKGAYIINTNSNGKKMSSKIILK